MAPGPREARIYRTGFERNDAYTAYLKLGSPAQLSPAQVDALQRLTLDEPELQRLDVGTDGVAQLTLPMRKYDVVLFELRTRASAP